MIDVKQCHIMGDEVDIMRTALIIPTGHTIFPPVSPAYRETGHEIRGQFELTCSQDGVQGEKGARMVGPNSLSL